MLDAKYIALDWRMQWKKEAILQWVMTSIDENVFCFVLIFQSNWLFWIHFFLILFCHSMCLSLHNRLSIACDTFIKMYMCGSQRTSSACFLFVQLIHAFIIVLKYMYNILPLKRKQQTVLCCFVLFFLVFLFHLTFSMRHWRHQQQCHHWHYKQWTKWAFLSFLEKPSCFDGNTFNSNASTKFNRLLYNCSVKWKIRARYIARWNRMYQCDRWKDKLTHTRARAHTNKEKGWKSNKKQ